MFDQWVPTEPPSLLPGRAALAWVELMLRSFVVSFVGLLGMGATFFVAPTSWRTLLVPVDLVLVVGAGVVGTYASIQGWRTAARERDRGYTTTYGDHLNLWQLDPTTGGVVRRPGERGAKRARRRLD